MGMNNTVNKNHSMMEMNNHTMGRRLNSDPDSDYRGDFFLRFRDRIVYVRVRPDGSVEINYPFPTTEEYKAEFEDKFRALGYL